MSNAPEDKKVTHINDKRGQKKADVREEQIPTFPMIVEMLLKGSCTNAEARHWVTLHQQAQATQEAAMREPNYMAMARASEEVYARCQPLAEELAKNFSEGEATEEDWRRQLSFAIDEKLQSLRGGSGDMRPSLLDITAIGMIALVELDLLSQPKVH